MHCSITSLQKMALSVCSLKSPKGACHCEAMKRCRDEKTGKQACHSTLPFENLRVLFTPIVVGVGGVIFAG